MTKPDYFSLLLLLLTPHFLLLTAYFSLLLQLDLAQPPGSAERQPHSIPSAVGLHVTHDCAWRRDRHDLHLLGLGIERHHVPIAGFAVPDPAISSDGDSVRPR